MTKASDTGTESSTKTTFKQEIQRLTEAMMNGTLDVRGDVASLRGEDAELLSSVNQMLDVLITPLRLASGSLREIAHGRIPEFVIDDFKGEFNEIRLNLNTLLATLFGIHKETHNLIEKINEGKLRTRGNDWDFEGVWRELIAGVNGTLDAVLDPVSEASSVLERLANYDLSARMLGKYHGEHAVIKKAMNATADSLHSAVSQVAETTALVSSVGKSIASSSEIVTAGATRQERQLAETSTTITYLAEFAQQNATNCSDARESALQAIESISSTKHAMGKMLSAMADIRASADSTATIIQEIDTIAKETDRLSSGAGSKASMVRSSASGFSVVASEVRKLAERCEASMKQLQAFQRAVTMEAKSGSTEETIKRISEYEDLIHDLKNISTNSGLLGVNAAISAAHVEGAGNDFEGLTEEIRQLARRSAEAAKLTDTQLQASTKLARGGEQISQEIDRQLGGAEAGAQTIDKLTEQISRGTQEQASGLEEMRRSIVQINEVTAANVASANESSKAARELTQQVKKLTTMLSKFKLESAAASA